MKQTLLTESPLFEVGRVVMTAAAADLISEPHALYLLSRHMSGDHGDNGAEDKAENNAGLGNGGRVLSVYNIADSSPVWIITESDHSVTTILTPADY